MSLLNLKKLSDAVNLKIGNRTLRKAAADSGVSFSTLNRISNGKEPDFNSYVAICEWLGASLNDFLLRNPNPITQKMPVLQIGTIVLTKISNGEQSGSMRLLVVDPEYTIEMANTQISKNIPNLFSVTDIKYITPPKP